MSESKTILKKEVILGLNCSCVLDLKTRRNTAAWVSVSTHRENIFQSKIKHDPLEIQIFKQSNVTKQMLYEGQSLEIVRQKVRHYIENYKVVTADKCAVLSALQLSDLREKVIDMQRGVGMFHGQNGVNDAIALRDLTLAVKGKKILEYYDESHYAYRTSPITLSRIIAKLYSELTEGLIKPEKDSTGGLSFEYVREKARPTTHVRGIQLKERMFKLAREMKKKDSKPHNVTTGWNGE